MVLSARGEQGVIWRLDTSTGTYAVKELRLRQTDEEVAVDVAFAGTRGVRRIVVRRGAHDPHP